MASVMIGNFGTKEGIATYRICGAKEDLIKIINECKLMDAVFENTPIVSHVHRGQWTMLLKLKVYVEEKKI